MAITKIGTPELFDFSATNTALQLPAGDTASRPTSPSIGEWRYNTELKNVEYYDGAAWFRIDDEALPSPVPVGSENFNVNTYFGNGATQVIDAKFNEAAAFNGSSSYIDLGNNVFNSLTSYTVSAWVKVSSTKNNQAIFSNWGYNGSTERGWIVGLLNGTQVRVFNYGSGGTQTFLSTASAISLNTWTNISITNTQSEVKIYINGSSDSNNPQSTNGFLIDASHPMSSQIGAYKYSSGIFGYFEGSIDQVRIYDSALDQAAVTALQLETTTTASSLSFPSGETATATYQLDGNGDDVSGTYSATSTTDVGYTGLKFTPDFVWIKQRSSPVRNHVLFDTVRGPATNLNILYSDLNNAQDTNVGSGFLSSISTNALNLGSSVYVNGSGEDYVAWNWKAGGAATDVTSSSTDVSSAFLSANADAGFSIVKYVQNGNSVVLPHGLDTTPLIIIVKKISASSNWFVYNNFVSGRGRGFLDTTSAFDNSGVPTFTSTNIEFQNQDPFSPDPGTTAVMYSFANVPGYSSIGSYPGNNSTNGPEIVTGFRPAFVMFKATNANGGNTFWVILDNKRDGTNTKRLYANSDSAEDPAEQVDFLSNSFKIRTNNSDINGNFSYIYLAIAS
mgnify:FL=1